VKPLSELLRDQVLLEAWQRFEKEEIGDDRNLTVQELAEKFLTRQKAQGRSTRTIIDDRSRLNAMTKVLGQMRAGAVKRADILRYVEGIAPGTNRRSHYKTLKRAHKQTMSSCHAQGRHQVVELEHEAHMAGPPTIGFENVV
jgi:hypothetical protein